MNSNVFLSSSAPAASSLAEFEAERDRLRTECSTLFDHKREIEMQMATLLDQKKAIEMQMAENQTRLQWLDDKIDGTGVGDGLITQQRDEATTTATDTKVKFEVVAERNNGMKKSNWTNNSLSMTQPEEYLTDPHTQLFVDDNDFLTFPPTLENMGNGENNYRSNGVECMAEELRRISKSPPLQMVHSNTPPGLKPSAKTAVVNPYAVGGGSGAAATAATTAGGNGTANRGTNVNPNPFLDLWNPTESNHRSTALIENCHINESRRSHGVNTLEKYFDGTNSHNSSATSQGMTATPSTMNQTNTARQHYPWSERMMYHLRHTFRIEKFRGHQEEIINVTMQGQDAFVVMRTGGGKSLTYQLPAVIESESRSRKVTVVISPLISLIRDQEEQMNQLIPGSAVSFTSNMAGGTSEHARRWGLVRDVNAGVALLFVTPEKVGKSTKLKGEMEKLHNQGRLGRFVVDECHCACQWGHDFRPDYTKLGILKHHFPDIPVLAVTATASERVRHDCAQILRLDGNYRFFRSTANRPNLNYSVRCKPDSKDALIDDMVDFIRNNHFDQAGIIYTFSKKEADDVANRLCDNGIVARSYHSDVHETTKDQVQRSWMRNQTQVVVATIAFGLGINKPDVRFVFHHSLSKSLEAYYQESGRAGRDGSPANCVLYYTPKDVPKMLGMIHGDAGESTLWAMAKYGQAHGDDALCRHIILATLGEADNTMGMTLTNLQNSCTTTERRQIGVHCQTVTRVVDTLNNISGEDCTINQVVAKWRSKTFDSNFSFLKDNPPGNDLAKDECERVVIYLILEDVLHPKVVYTAYNTIVYLVLGPDGQKLLASTNPRAEISFPIRPQRKQAGSSKKLPSNPLAISDGDGWISATSKPKKAKAGKTKSTSTKAKSARNSRKPTVRASGKGSKTASRRKTAGSKMPIIVEINSSSSSETGDDSDDDFILPKRRASSSKKRKEIADDSDCDLSE